MKKKILFLLYDLNIGGTEKALINMLEVMDESKFDVDVFLLRKYGGFINELPSWINLKIIDDYFELQPWILEPPLLVIKKLLLNMSFIKAFKLFVTHILFKITNDRTLYYDVVLSYMKNIDINYDCAIAYAGPHDFITRYILKKVNATEKIQWIHFDVSKFNFNIEFAKTNYKNFDKIIACSSASANVLKSVLDDNKLNIEVVYNFVSRNKCILKSKEFNPYTNDEIDNKQIVLTVGRLTEEKGQIIIPKIVFNLVEEGTTNFIWYIVGDGKEYDSIKNLINDYSLNNYIKMVGTQSNPYPYYANCDLYVQTSLHEGYCITIGEALLFNKYVISTDVAGAHDQIKNSNIGIICKYCTTELSKNISDYLKGKFNE